MMNFILGEFLARNIQISTRGKYLEKIKIRPDNGNNKLIVEKNLHASINVLKQLSVEDTSNTRSTT